MTNPTLTSLARSVTFGEALVNAGAQLIDGAADFAGGSGGILVVSGILAEDTVSVRSGGTGAGEISRNGSDLALDSVVIGAVSGGAGADLVITFTPAASEAAIDAVIDSLTYANRSDAPTASRTLSIVYSDGGGNELTPMLLAARTGSNNPFDVVAVGAESSPFLADLDGDGDLDLLVGAQDGTVSYFLNTGSAAAPSFALQSGGDDPFDGVAGGAGSAAKPGLVDLDDDGDLDLAVGLSSGAIPYFENTGSAADALFTTSIEVLSVGSRAAPTAIDIDADGDLDAVVGNEAGKLAFFRNLGTAAEAMFSRAVGASSPFDSIDIGDRAVPSFGDIDGDGDLDLAVGAGDGTLRFFENTGSATAAVFTERTGSASPFDGIDVGSFASPALVDADGDGDLDVVVGGDGGTLAYFENTATLAVVVTITPDNDSPRISSGNGATDSVTVAENGTAVIVVTASDPDSLPVFQIAGGTDAARFSIDATTGALSFVAAPDYEAPGDADGDNVYDVVVEVSDGLAAASQAVTVTVSDVAGVTRVGGRKGDVLGGAGEADRIEGRKGKDMLSGLGGDDTLDGGKGNDRLAGGDGADSFMFADKLKGSTDKVLDFEAGIDAIVLDSGIFRTLAPGPLSEADFVVGKSARDGSDRIVYDDRKGLLLYDADGKAGGKTMAICKIGKGADLGFDDILVI